MLMLVDTRDPRYGPEPPDRDGPGRARPGWPLVLGLAGSAVLVLVAKELPAVPQYLVMLAAFGGIILSLLSLAWQMPRADAEEQA